MRNVLTYLQQTGRFIHEANRKTYVDSLHYRILMKSTFITVIMTSLILIVPSFVIMQQIQAQEGNIIITFLSGKEEVPPTKSSANAWTK
jgi:hypothetical protein